MKIGNVVKVIDGSWSMTLIKSVLAHSGSDLRNRRFRVLAVDGIYPTDERQNRNGREVNNVLLSDVNDRDFVLFTQERFCRVVTPIPESKGDTIEVPIPRNAKKIILNLF